MQLKTENADILDKLIKEKEANNENEEEEENKKQ